MDKTKINDTIHLGLNSLHQAICEINNDIMINHEWLLITSDY